MDRQWFIFYNSFYEALSDLPDQNQLELYRAIAEYSFTFNEPTNLTGVSKTIWKLIKPQLDANNKRFQDWKRGGRPKKETSGFENEITSGFENKKPKEKEKEKVKEKENILSTNVDNSKADGFWNEDVNECLEIIKKFNDWIVDWTVKEQRQYAKLLIDKLQKIESVKLWNYTWNQVLETILQIVSQNTYHAQKIAWPKKIYYELWGLMQICKQEFWKAKTKEIPFISWIW